MYLYQVPQYPIALDVRIASEQAAQKWLAARDYSLWPDSPFGCSVDTAVWPSVFCSSNSNKQDKIEVPPLAEYWSAFELWDDLEEMTSYLTPKSAGSEMIAICIDRDYEKRPTKMSLVAALCDSAIDGKAMQSRVTILGYDICDAYFTSMILNAGATNDLRAKAPPRTKFGLIANRQDGIDLIPILEEADPSHAPLLLMAIYSLGTVDAFD